MLGSLVKEIGDKGEGEGSKGKRERVFVLEGQRTPLDRGETDVSPR